MSDLYFNIDTGIFLKLSLKMVLEHFRSPTMYEVDMVTFLVNFFLLMIAVEFLILESKRKGMTTK